jgi:hypothetical protein
MPTNCDPWPGNSTASLPAGPRPKCAPSGVCQLIASGSAASFAFTPAMSFGRSASERCAAKHSRHGAEGSNEARDASAARAKAFHSVGSFASSVASASGVSAPSATISTEPSQSSSRFSGAYSSSTAWKLLPPKPNAESAARRGWSGRGSQGRIWPLT